MENVKLTQYSHGAGCGCKISPVVLDSILAGGKVQSHPSLIVGNDARDDAAAFDLGDGTAVLSTTDFFMPIVDDPFIFGKIAATNALSDIYAMGGEPMMAVAILGWPVNSLPTEVAALVINGGRAVCQEAGIPLAGGHSIDTPEPIFGLAATGRVNKKHLKRNDTAKPGCALFLTKPIGIGILTTARKMGVVEDNDIQAAINTMCQLNSVGAEIAKMDGVAAMTDVTGFALLGHLREMCAGSGVSARINVDTVPLLPNLDKYLALECVPGGTFRNFESYGSEIGGLSSERDKAILCDPQTSGGLLVAVEKDVAAEFAANIADLGLNISPIGELSQPLSNLVEIVR